MAKKFNDVVHYVHNVRENGAIVSKTSNALVISSTINDGREMLQIIYLDAAFDRPILSGADVQSALRTVFSAPHVESTFKGSPAQTGRPTLPPPAPAQGWKDVEVIEEGAEKPTLYVRPDATLAGLSGAPVTVEVVEGKVPFGSRLLAPDANYHASTEDVAAALESQVEEQKIAAETAGPDGTTSPSESAPAQADVAAKEEHGDVGEASPAPPTE